MLTPKAFKFEERGCEKHKANTAILCETNKNCEKLRMATMRKN